MAWISRRRLIQTTRTQQRILDLAEEFFLFHAQADGATGLRITNASSSLGRILGASISTCQNDSSTVLRMTHPDDRHGLLSTMASAIADRLPLRRRFRIVHPDYPRPRHLLLHAMPLRGTNPLEFDGLVLDLTTETEATGALLEVQQRLEKTQRNESLGLLAGGVAHDFNNLLGGIRGNAELALAHLPPAHEARPRLDRLLQAVDRAAGLVRQILAYAGRGSIEIRPIDIIDECQTLLDLLKHSVPKNITLKLETPEKLPPVLFDPAQLQQVLINLLMNAAESYLGNPGLVLVKLSRFNASTVEIVITDRGCGMDEATQARMFEPYFTTKKTGHGLGLAAVQGIIQASGADMHCHSRGGVGTTFTLHLATDKTPSQDLTAALTTPPPGGTHLLVVDDNEIMREIAAQMVRELGYTVDVACGGEEAQQFLADPKRVYALIILDCSMPDVDGPTIVRDLRKRGQRIPVVLVSGMMDAAKLGTGVLDRQTRFLAKPFSKALLDRTLRILLRTPDKNDSLQNTFAAMQRESQVQQVVRPETTNRLANPQPPTPPPSPPTAK
ncbi:MAG: ATP-binding protein [Planctomycetota bacterium]